MIHQARTTEASIPSIRGARRIRTKPVRFLEPGNDFERQNDRIARSSFTNARKNVSGEYVDTSITLKDERAILEILQRYLEYHLGKDFDRYKGGRSNGTFRS